jgi:hypothetical protein
MPRGFLLTFLGRGRDVLMPTAGAVHAAATSSTLDADWLQRAGAAAKRRAKPKQRKQQKKQKVGNKNQMTALIGKKRQRGGSGVAETQMATEEEGDEEANSSSGDRQGGDRQNRVGGGRQDGDRQDGESEENSRATRSQRLGGGGKAGFLT